MAQNRTQQRTDDSSAHARDGIPVAEGSTAAGHPADAEVAAHLRTALDGRWREVRDKSRALLNDAAFLDDPGLDLAASRQLALDQMRRLVGTDWPASGFGVEAGGTGDP